MALYAYRAVDENKEIIQANASATSREELAQELSQRGLTPISIKEIKRIKRTGSLPIVEKISFCRYISTMLKSGLSLTESIDVLAEEAKHPLTKKILDDLKFGINHGQTLSTIFSHYPNTFDKFFVTLVRSGEISGTLSETFEHIQEEIRAEHSLSQKIQSALLYPAVVFIAMGGIGVLMFFFILPQIGKVFFNLNLPLNPAVEFMFKTTLFLSDYKYWILLGVVVAIISGIIFLQTRLGKRTVLILITPVPVVKNLIKQIDMARFCRIFSALLRSGVPVTQALEISLGSMSFGKFSNTSDKIIDGVSKGKNMAEAFKGVKAFPSLLIQMLSAGEKSGTLDETLHDLGEFYAEEVENGVKKLTQLLEPVLMLMVGVGVGIMILSVITPIYSVVSNIQSIQ